MSTHDYNLANQSGASFRSDLNNCLAAILSNNSNASDPSTTVAFMTFADSNTGKLKIRNSANDGFVDLINLDGTIARDLQLTGASANIVFDQSDNALEFADGALASFGTNTDLTISHVDGTGNVIDSAVGDFFVKHGAETMIKADADGSVELYEDNQLRIETSSSGAVVSRNEVGDALLVVSNLNTDASADANIRMLIATTTGHSRVQFGDSGDSDVGRIDYDHDADDMTFAVNATNMYEMDTGAFHPSTDDGPDVGTSSRRFDNIRATNNVIQTSDKNEKNTIVASDLGLDFINKLSPVSYKFNNKTRTHYGLIAQDIETVLGTISKTATDFAGFCKDTITEDGTGNTLDTPLDRYGLRYTEFIAPMIKAIQELSAKVTALEGS